jgi:hypothetical protein
MCWSSLFGLVVVFCDILRYMTHPFPPTVCYLLILFKMMLKSMLLFYLDALILVR